jgi:hypothetical protein
MDRKDKLQQLRDLRSKGKTRLSVYESVEKPQIFDSVSEDFFHEVSKRRAMEDDFVVDDNGEGYVAPLEDWVTHYIKVRMTTSVIFPCPKKTKGKKKVKL